MMLSGRWIISVHAWQQHESCHKKVGPVHITGFGLAEVTQVSFVQQSSGSEEEWLG